MEESVLFIKQQERAELSWISKSGMQDFVARLDRVADLLPSLQRFHTSAILAHGRNIHARGGRSGAGMSRDPFTAHGVQVGGGGSACQRRCRPIHRARAARPVVVLRSGPGALIKSDFDEIPAHHAAERKAARLGGQRIMPVFYAATLASGLVDIIPCRQVRTQPAVDRARSRAWSNASARKRR